MNIVGFGDSFIMGLPYGHPDRPNTYQSIISDHYNTEAEFRGVPGTGPWNAFFDFINYKKHVDIAIIAWSEASRLYHPHVPVLNSASVEKDRRDKNHPFPAVINAAYETYRSLLDHNKQNYELRALMTLLDSMHDQYPNTKFIHLHCFSWDEPNQWWGDYYHKKGPKQLKYHHRFKYGAEIRPALMYMSMKDEWVVDLSKEKRKCHLSLRMHKLLADAIIDAIDNYEHGKLVEINHREFDIKR